MGNLQYVVDLIKQAFDWLNSRFDDWFPKATKTQLMVAKAAALLVLVVIAYFMIHPVPWEQSKGLHILAGMHKDCVKGERPDWPLDWKPIPTEQKPAAKSDDEDKGDEESAKTPAGGKTSSSIAPIDKANNLLISEKYDAAAKLLSRLKTTTKGDDLIPVVNNLGFAELHLGRYKEAIEDLTQAVNLKEELRDKSATKALLSGPEISSEANLGEAYFYAGKLNEANEHLTTADNGADAVQEQLPANFKAEIAYFLGLNDLMQKNMKAGVKDLQKATKLENESIAQEGEKISDRELSNWAACNAVLGMALQEKGEIAQAARMYLGIGEKLKGNETALIPESRKIIKDCEQTTMPVWQRLVGTVDSPQPTDEK